VSNARYPSLRILQTSDFHGAILAILPPGAFIFLGLLIALKNLLDKRARQRQAALAKAAPPAAEPQPAA